MTRERAQSARPRSLGSQETGLVIVVVARRDRADRRSPARTSTA